MICTWTVISIFFVFKAIELIAFNQTTKAQCNSQKSKTNRHDKKTVCILINKFLFFLIMYKNRWFYIDTVFREAYN